jgi:hypothetical protein
MNNLEELKLAAKETYLARVEAANVEAKAFDEWRASIESRWEAADKNSKAYNAYRAELSRLNGGLNDE